MTDSLRDKAYADFYPECDEEKSVYGIWCAAWVAALAAKGTPADPPDERALFEEWYRASVLHNDPWYAWKARAALATKPAEPDALQVRLKMRGDMKWIDCPSKADYETAIGSGQYEGRKLYVHPTESAGKSPEAVIALLLKTCRQAFYALKGREHDQFLRDAIKHAEAWVLANHEATCLAETQRSSNATRSDEQTSTSVQPPAPTITERELAFALNYHSDDTRIDDADWKIARRYFEVIERNRGTHPSLAAEAQPPAPEPVTNCSRSITPPEDA